VLPEDRADILEHSYDGGGVKVTGPALLVRKSVGQKVSLSGSYYVDNVSSASVDVVTTASPYKEQRRETGIGLDFLHRDAVMGLSFSRSNEPDYRAETMALKLSQDTFGGMTTVSLGYSVGKDVVLSNIDPNFHDHVNRYQYRLGLSQVLTKSWLMSLVYEGITDEGYLNSPYRAARVLGTPVPEIYPRARSSHAYALGTQKYFESRSALKFTYRNFRDNWEIHSNTYDLVYSSYLGSRWLVDTRLRYYKQNRAVFYADNFAREQNYMARDKELSTFTSKSAGLQGSYRLFGSDTYRGTLNASYDYLYFDYDDFTDLRTGKLYAFHANVIQLFFSFVY
jgi:hypothetical protein